MTREENEQMGSNMGTASGALLGNTLMPIPVVGGLLGGVAGGFLGKKLGGLFGKKNRIRHRPINISEGFIGNSIMRNGGLLVGNSHENGGINMGNNVEAENGEILFNNTIISNVLKDNRTNKTFSSLMQSKNKKDRLRSLILQKKYLKQGISNNLDNKTKAFGGLDFGGNSKMWLSKNKNTFNGALQNSSAILDIGRGLFSKTRTPKIPDVDFSAINKLKTTVNVNPQLRQVNDSFNSIMSNPNLNINSALASQSNMIKTKSDILGEKENKEIALFNNKQQIINQMNQQQNQVITQRSNNKLLAREARSNLFGSGLNKINQVMNSNKQFKLNNIANQLELAKLTKEQKDYLLKNPDFRNLLLPQKP